MTPTPSIENHSLKTTAHRSQQIRQIWLAWLCALCLLGFQGVGHWHRIAHAGGQSTFDKATAWGHHSGDADCKLFDQLSHDMGPGSAAIGACSASVQLSATDPVSIRIDSAALWKRGARGPPISL